MVVEQIQQTSTCGHGLAMEVCVLIPWGSSAAHAQFHVAAVSLLIIALK